MVRKVRGRYEKPMVRTVRKVQGWYEKSMERNVHGTKSPPMVRNVYGTNSLWYEKSGSRTYGRQWYIARAVRGVTNTDVLDERRRSFDKGC